MDLSNLTKAQLLVKCNELGIKRCKSKDKTSLINLIQQTTSNTAPTNSVQLIPVLKDLIAKYGYTDLSEQLSLADGTVKRWVELNSIPKNYEFDLLKLANMKINYAKYSSKEKDQFYTPLETVQRCYKIFCDILKQYNENETDYTYIEPSAGDGNFVKVLPPERTIAMDIEPLHESVFVADYLSWKPGEAELPHSPLQPCGEQSPPNGGMGARNVPKYVVIGNPPFGLRGHTALQFINHSAPFADYVCFILPQLFESDGKGVPRKRVKGFNLIYSEKVDPTFYEPDKRIIKINTIYQIWSKHHTNPAYELKSFTTDHLKIYSMSDGGTSSSTRNKDMIGKCDFYLPSTCFGAENMKCYNSFENLPGRKGYGIVFNHDKEQMLNKARSISWEKVAFLSTNSAYNLRSSQIMEVF